MNKIDHHGGTIAFALVPGALSSTTTISNSSPSPPNHHCYVLIDIPLVSMNATKYQGWGKEDGDFFTRVLAMRKPRRMNVLRWKETGLVHIWHPKYCIVGRDVIDTDMQDICMMVRKDNEGSATAAHLNDLIQNDFPAFERLWKQRSSRRKRNKDPTYIFDMAEKEYNMTLLEMEQEQRIAAIEAGASTAVA
jgi:hypothetical protein